MSKVKDLSIITKTTDWSFSSPYKGTIAPLKQSLEQLAKEFTLPVDFRTKIVGEIPQAEQFTAYLDKGTEVPEIPIDMLGKDNPILHYGQVVLYEDEFADRGYSKAYVRFRVMHDCFFLLQRSYIRIDHVTVRIMDTRIFH